MFVAVQRYPDIFVSSGLHDPRVAYWEPAKWVAKLRTLKQGDSMLLHKTNMGAGALCLPERWLTVLCMQ